ncbi:hypothetical protein [Anaerobacillus sp. 1_MG-2023]|uniref:hypothetical protein n=1 Tax=Anaerobacillus sp. 1_MG-2023 TaxID=3062655 RepID=UPI0026E350DC|nr:hypothetical protein [Anaerobacillus sp. 1_MG-2023]MDO6657405.1 hypothetical protein [Anaerobacillus sp. 1_MG-2023]
MRKKPKVRGESCMLRTKQNEPQYIMDWINSQSNFSKSIRHLIEKDVAENGIRDLKEEMMYKQIHPGTPQGTPAPVASKEHEVDRPVEHSALKPSEGNKPISSSEKEEGTPEVHLEKNYEVQNVSESVINPVTEELAEGREEIQVKSDSVENDNPDKKKGKKVQRNIDVSSW